MALDHAKLVNLRRGNGGSITAGCPACIEAGRDHSRDHLIIYPDGRFGCIANQGDESHRQRIWALAGDGSSGEIGALQIEVHEPVEILRTWPAELLDRLVHDHSYWINRGVKESVLEPLRGGVATTGSMANRYIFPIFNDADEIVGFTGRALSPKMQIRWKHTGKVSTWVWGGLEAIAETRQAVIVEGAGCRLALASHGIEQSMVLWGTNLSQGVLGALIAANPHDIIVATNNEASGIGQQAALKCATTLNRFFDPGIVRLGLPLAKDFLDQTEDQWTQWIETVLKRSNSILDNPDKIETMDL